MSNHRGAVPKWLDQNYLEDISRKYLKDPSLKIVSIDITPGSSEGDNYVCQVLRIKLFLADGHNKNIIVKIKPDTKLLQEGLPDGYDLFGTESKFYEVFWPKFKEILGKKTYIPECQYIDHENNTIIMEDLREIGFRLENRGVFLGLEQTELVIDALASFHGASLHVLKENPQLIKSFTHFLWMDPLPHVIKSVIENGTAALKKHLPSYKLPEKYNKVLLRIQDEIDNGKMELLVAKEGKLNVLAHGDSWKNNLMFHFADKIADDVRLIDFQTTHYNSFANDLNYFLFFNIGSDILVNKLDYLLERYFKKVKEIAPDTPEWTLPRVKEEFIERIYYGFLLAVLFRPFVIADHPIDVESTMDDGGALQDNGFELPGYRSDLHKLMPFFEKFGLFDK